MQEPWRFGTEVTDIFRKYVKLRYALLPYYYDLFRQCEQTACRPCVPWCSTMSRTPTSGK